jgi:hypothetical protein
MKKFTGIPDADYEAKKISDAAIFYPPAVESGRWKALESSQDPCDLTFRMSSEERTFAEKAAAAYMQGHSKKVSSYEPMLNALYFPSQLTVVSGEELVVPSGSTFVINAQNPVLNFASVTVEYGGQIQVLVSASITTQTFTSGASS